MSDEDLEARSSVEDPVPSEAERPRRPTVARLVSGHKYIAGFLGAVGTATLGVIVPQLIHKAERWTTAQEAPLAVQVITDITRFRSGAGHVPQYLIPGSASALGPPPNRYAADPILQHRPPDFDPERYAWAHALGGVDANETLLRLSISGTSAAATDLQQIRVRIVRCTRPLSGTEVSYTGLGDAIGTRFFTVNLDQQPPTVKYVGTGATRRPGPQPFPMRVTDSIQEEFDITADVLNSDCQWDLLLDWTQGQHSGTVVISNNGKPFRTTTGNTRSGPAEGVAVVYWDPKLQRWVRPNI
jgi:hypothetical protein